VAIVTISRGSYSLGKEIATQVAAELGYRCISREIILDAAKQFGVPEETLTQAIESPPSLLDRLTKDKSRYVAYVRTSLLRQLCADEVVYHGLAGHFFVQGVSHVVKVRVVADVDDRATVLAERDGVDEKDAAQRIKRSDQDRRQWSMSLYGTDPEDPSLYDLFIHVGKVGVHGAVVMICEFAKQKAFRTTAQSQAALDDLALAAEVEAQIVDMDSAPSEVEVTAHHGEVRVVLKSGPRILGGSDQSFRSHYMESLQHQLYQRSRRFPGLRDLRLELAED
jgi:cytidylate kinase